MKHGIMIGLVRSENILIMSQEEIMLEDFMAMEGITETQDVYVMPKTYSDNKEFKQKVFEGVHELMKALVNQHSNYYERFDWKRTLKDCPYMSLLQAISSYGDRYLPKPPEQESNGTGCECGQTFPESDGFGGVTMLDSKTGKEVLRCFKCYQKTYNKIGV